MRKNCSKTIAKNNTSFSSNGCSDYHVEDIYMPINNSDIEALTATLRFYLFGIPRVPPDPKDACVKMEPGTATTEENPTHSYLGSRGIWITYVLIIFLFHLLLLSVPFFTVAVAWTLTNVFHDVWEQIDNGQHFTPTKKFLTIVPIVLFFLASFYTKYDKVHFIVNAVALAVAVLPKLPMFHGVRIFGINKW
ncbi:hypothetical protein KUTeg_008188 [Tegillarca granosa]|uniref:ORM1-like protein 2 n=1 Tax=Tegillarca granosa TaxID=220873 RepID=A0ABQ9F8F1_TEGGR|nr:hypothetical protein KUTeg_008188 [Tegillarca granosa]